LEYRFHPFEQGAIRITSGLSCLKALALGMPTPAPKTHTIAADAQVRGNCLVAEAFRSQQNRFGAPHQTLGAGLAATQALEQLLLFLT
jgi:hypothetical protein